MEERFLSKFFADAGWYDAPASLWFFVVKLSKHQ
jgi:hypothetical protein